MIEENGFRSVAIEIGMHMPQRTTDSAYIIKGRFGSARSEKVFFSDSLAQEEVSRQSFSRKGLERIQ